VKEKRIEPTPAELRRASCDAQRREVETEVDSAIARIHSGSGAKQTGHAEELIEGGGERLGAIAATRLFGDFMEAVGDACNSMAELKRVAAEEAAAQAALVRRAPQDTVGFWVAIVYIVGALVAFFTELRLSDALVTLLGYRRDDPAGKAIGAAFASCMMVFDFVFARLCLVAPPWRLFRARRVSTPGWKGTGVRICRGFGGACIIVALLSVAALAAATVFKAAAVRPIAAALLREHRNATVTESLIAEEAALYFSICVLVTGGYMAAAGTAELSKWSKGRRLEQTIESLGRQRRGILTALEKAEKPAVAGVLANYGVSPMWLPAAAPGIFPHQIADSLKTLPDDVQSGIRALARTEAAMFVDGKMIELEAARLKVRAKLSKSYREMADDVLDGGIVAGV
jgi:hypothetical protein